MSDRDRQLSLMRAIRGPITLITVGVLFALNNFTEFSFDKTWPVLLIVFGLLSLHETRYRTGATATSAGATLSAAGLRLSRTG